MMFIHTWSEVRKKVKNSKYYMLEIQFTTEKPR